jgi:hypothetical protein
MAYSERNELKQTTARIVSERKRLMQEARTGGDVGDAIREFNASVPKVFRITSDQIKSSKDSKRDREAGKLRKEERAVAKLLGQ